MVGRVPGSHAGRVPRGITAESWAVRWKETLAGDELPPVRVAVDDGTVLGFRITAAPSRDKDLGETFAEVVALNVRPEVWGQGIGTALMTDALDHFYDDGWKAVSLWVVDGNDRAQRFYERLGFRFDGASTKHEATGACEVRMWVPLIAGSR